MPAPARRAEQRAAGRLSVPFWDVTERPPFTSWVAMPMTSDDWVTINSIAQGRYRYEHGTKVRKDNWLTYIAGACGEWVAFKYVRRVYREVITQLSEWVPVTTRGDIVVDGKHFEVKCVIGGYKPHLQLEVLHLHINRDAFLRDKVNKLGVTGYVPVLVPQLYGSLAMLGTVIPFREVANWECGDRAHTGAPCYYRKVRELLGTVYA